MTMIPAENRHDDPDATILPLKNSEIRFLIDVIHDGD